MSSRRITCPGCTAVWAGMNVEHCAGCHRTFSSTQAGDAHRVGEHGSDRRCMTDAEIFDKNITSGPNAGEPWFRVEPNAFGTNVWSRNTPGKINPWTEPGAGGSADAAPRGDA